MKKRIIALLLAFVTLFALVACGDKDKDDDDDDQNNDSVIEGPMIPWSPEE